MFVLGFIIGLYGFGVYLLGLLSLLYAPVLWIYTVAFVVGSGFYWKRNRGNRGIRKIGHENPAIFLLFGILVAQVLVNFVGALGPEIGFDALWYHLTLPKIYLLNHAILHIPGGLLYYSDMPKFVELLYTAGLSFGSTIFPKLIHFGFGILTMVVLFRLSRKLLPKVMALFVVLVFAANLVVGWELGSAYIDLGRTFFELLSICALLNWFEIKAQKWFFYSAIFMGFAIVTKILAIESLLIICVLIAIVLKQQKQKGLAILKNITMYILISLLIPLPWLAFSFIHTGNPIYPFFSQTYPISFPWQLFNPLYFVSSFLGIFLYSADPINPVYLMVLPLVILFFQKWPRHLQLLTFYVAGGLFFWYITPRTGGGRFILPYLPLFSLISVIGILSLPQKWLKQLLFAVIILISISSIGYRAIASAKFVPVILGKESTNTFLVKHLNFSFGDFIDSDGYFKKAIKPTDTVLLYGFHNLYYVDFPFIDSSWVTKGNVFTYIATQNAGLPKRFQNWNLVYTNPVTHVNLYSAGGIPWTY